MTSARRILTRAQRLGLATLALLALSAFAAGAAGAADSKGPHVRKQKITLTR